MINVTVWNEFIHEREIPEVKSVYPEGIHRCIADFLSESPDISVKCVTLSDPKQGLSEELLSETDVLIWWGHCAHDKVTDENAELVKRHVLGGMGFIPLHSAHLSKPFLLLTGTTNSLKWRDDDRETLWCVNPAHPIASGVPERLELPREEMYGEPFDIPKPDDVVFAGWFSGGELFRSGVTFSRGKGSIFYFQPGHETNPTYYDPAIRRIIENAVRWTCPFEKHGAEPRCIHNLLG